MHGDLQPMGGAVAKKSTIDRAADQCQPLAIHFAMCGYNKQSVDQATGGGTSAAG